MLIAMAGLPGTGKSTLAQHLAVTLGAVVLNKDAIRATLFALDDVEYAARQDDFCLSIMFQVASYLWTRDGPTRHIILDGRTFSRRYQRTGLTDFAQESGVPVLFVECVCTDETVRSRLEHDTVAGVHPAQDRDYALYLRVKGLFEPITESKVIIDTDGTLEDYLSTCLAAVHTLLTP